MAEFKMELVQARRATRARRAETIAYSAAVSDMPCGKILDGATV